LFFPMDNSIAVRTDKGMGLADAWQLRWTNFPWTPAAGAARTS
jgi:hypothetical protein